MKKNLIIALVLYIASSAVSYGVFSSMNQSSPSEIVDPSSSGEDLEPEGTLLTIEPGEPRDQVCPLNGQLYTQTERDAWEKRRPLAVMIENAPDARPQSGLIRADMVFEAMAEGGVTRFMAMYYCDAQRDEVVLAPIRSARTYYVDWASGFNKPLYVHVGGANLPGKTNALGQIDDYGWNNQNDLNQFSIGYPTFKRDYNRVPGKDIATEHTMVTTTELLWDVGEKRKWTNTDPKGNEWSEDFETLSFMSEIPETKGDVTKASFEFWDGYENYAVEWNYDAQTNSYKRVMAGQPHKDLETDEQIAVKNAVVLFSAEEGPINELKHMFYRTTGTGTAIVFQNGEAIEVNWSKPKRESALLFTDKKGKPFEFVPGKIWISVVDIGTDVTY